MKSNLDKLFKTDNQLETEGIFIELDEGVRFKIKRFGGANASAMKRAMAKHHKPHAKLIEKGLFPEEKQQAIYTKIFVESCFLDWEGVEVDGEKVPYSNEAAIKLLTNLPDLFTLLVEMSQDKDNFIDDVGN